MGKIFIAGLTFFSFSLSITDPNITGASSIAYTLEYGICKKTKILEFFSFDACDQITHCSILGEE
jgi:hypothetical protein